MRPDEQECTKCHQVKPVSEYYAFKNRPHRRCRACELEYKRGRGSAYYRNNVEKIKQANRNRYHKNPLQRLVTARIYKHEHPERAKKTNKIFARQWRKNNPDKVKARNLLNSATRYGTLPRPDKCSECGEGGRIEGHHYAGYEGKNALKVKWYCHYCHRKVHSTYKLGKITNLKELLNV